MNKPLILVVEDDSSVKNLITTTLKALVPSDSREASGWHSEFDILW